MDYGRVVRDAFGSMGETAPPLSGVSPMVLLPDDDRGVEREVLLLLTTGVLNKQIAAELGAAENTINVHRSRIRQTMQVRSASALTSLLYRAQSHAYRAG